MLAAVPHPGGAVQGREELGPPSLRGLEDRTQETGFGSSGEHSTTWQYPDGIIIQNGPGFCGEE